METDYSQIASRYDKNRVRRKEVDSRIGEVLKVNPRGITVLDLACGTGKYLKIQSEYYKNAPVRWLGADRSREMLAVSKSKGINAGFICCDAGDPSLSGDSEIDYIRCEYAWHHFSNHSAVIGNIARMLKPGGLFTMVNICPEYMKNYWVHHYFPETAEIDRKRFVKSEEILKSFRLQGFKSKIKITTIVSEMNLEKILDEAENRDISQLTLINDDQYKAGIHRIKKDLESSIPVVHDMSFLNMEASLSKT